MSYKKVSRTTHHSPIPSKGVLHALVQTPPSAWLPESFEGHIPVMFREVLSSWLGTTEAGFREGIYVDATLGGGGHSYGAWHWVKHLASSSDTTKAMHWYGIDQDSLMLQQTQKKLHTLGHTQLHTRHGNFAQLSEWVNEGTLPKISGGLLLDLGVSSFQLDTPERGFSFRHDAPLDMRMNPSQGVPLYEWLETQTEERLKQVLWDYGEERYAGTIARWILQDKPTTTHALAKLVERVYFKRGGKKEAHHHPATRTFQALRIALNQELD
ncbi:MAG: 16S rRNA (cytosine(1402)-N(4))-methyltransferase RsmH, partial [Vampirovibrionales bacterium]